MMYQFDQEFKQAALIGKFLKNELSDLEQAELDQWLVESEKNRILFNELTNEDLIRTELSLLEQFPADADWNSVASRTIHYKPSITIMRRLQQRWYYVAAVLLMIAVSTYLLLNRQENKQDTVIAGIEKAKGIAPGTNKALITVADGTVIEINDSTQGLLSKQENVNLVVKNGEVIYQPIGENAKPQFNTITTPKGGQYRLVLADGTKVWLNAASSLKYPTEFTGNERKVELQGEGYFEVVHNASHPFKVSLPGKGEVEDIGTAFNINSYANESFIKTTLLEGKVKVSAGAKTLLLKPNQQARIGSDGQIMMDDSFDTEETIAWKNGRFVFKSVTLEHIMKQIERWYDIDVVYKSKVSQERFSAIISRSGSLSEVLKMMSDGGVKFTLEGKTLILY